MIKTLLLLICAVLGNAIGTALMTNTKLGLTAWGSAASNIASFFHISFGTAFIIMAIVFYVIAMLMKKKMSIYETLLSFGFLFSFGILSDVFIHLFPDMSKIHYALRLFINFSGFSILIFSIALHLKLLIAVHPCDVFLYQMQVVCKHDAVGTYVTYGIAFSIAIIFGLSSGAISGIGIGTVFTLCLSGLFMRFFNRFILSTL